jgi:hypothetical protein
VAILCRRVPGNAIDALRNAVLNSAAPDAPDADTQAMFLNLSLQASWRAGPALARVSALALQVC